MNNKNNGLSKGDGSGNTEGKIKASERRNSKRFDERLHARLETKICAVLNVSAKGVLLKSSMPELFLTIDQSVEMELQLEDGQWVTMRATVMWVQNDQQHSKIGLFIQYAPEPYFEFLRELYE
ncbi:MAG: PilZ domain-containing protein [bacterium]|nr:PilZ domain-containing protein [bacterium]